MSDLPAGLRPPEVALARLADTIPGPGALPGGSLYEPKWDGFRLVIVRAADVTLWSRQGKDLTRHFPDLAAAAEEQLPHGYVVDGEAVVWSEDRLDFDALQKRLTTSPAAVQRLAHQRPASYAAFDLLAVDDHDARSLPLRDRRALLEQLAQDWAPPLNLSPATTDYGEAVAWFEQLHTAGIEGLVIKGAGDRYSGGVRQWVKVKHRDTLDVICAAVIGTLRQPQELVVGLPVDGELRIVGRSTPLRAAPARGLGRLLRPAVGEGHPWPAQIKPGALDRFGNSGRELVDLTLVEPIVVEISADVAWSGRSFRHAVRYLRARPELDLADVPERER
ncbi:ATP-dependent DNA ligase [Cnuibacter physcomitrellae]|uniref:ATP-dependent DNA ligase n=1 Tax=Cnuibacter physcomitrellae TaxID=1619308 RepID=A0A1X9LUI1_9MICO|nr:ATP-dependent DNA ligase [Cnuibacter physcomitrellae]ARJ07671.1 ATP-dependent DNA ligase [Cnuibacter physcomitrellae]GGI42640.1 ATP-dependent DNA ligase [Cnuibacter physcomitrellae]